ncbi:MAG: hypothetical protein N5P05_002075 [Chroococcopsis gigantea SAG 12.99]|jgi:Uma2 family endonuclease|nr:Uma2 family endonuclease [Chlorogloea purpurea SAG 13.99]MDV3000469.1 hypothetical protein [Chroococcopsis gigantea SAG 12.99]
MVAVRKKLYSFEEYLEYDDGTDTKYELFNGELIPMPPASGFHALILCFLTEFLVLEIKRLNLEWKIMPGNVGVRTDRNKSRIPDLIIIDGSQCQELKTMRSAVMESPPILAIEIVSPGNSDHDYRYKRSEYAVSGINEYWIIDPLALKVSILTLVSGFYEVTQYEKEAEIVSPTFSEIKLTPKMIFESP